MGLLNIFLKRYNESELIELPSQWNKDSFHHIMFKYSIEGSNEIFENYGYLWATDNWVEIHVFKIKHNDEISEYAGYDCNCFLNDEFRGTHPVIKKMSGTVYYEHCLSAILPRQNVKYSSGWFNNILYITITNADLSRWLEWHPDNKYQTKFPDTFKGNFCYETHQGELCNTWKID